MKPQPQSRSVSNPAPAAGRTLGPTVSQNVGSTNAANTGFGEPRIIDATVIESQPVAGPEQAPLQPQMPCPACGSPRQTGSRFCVACGIPFETPNKATTSPPPRTSSNSNYTTPIPSLNRGPATDSIDVSQDSRSLDNVTTVEQSLETRGHAHVFRCESCGSEMDIQRDQRSLRCPFCDSTYVIELDSTERTRQRPEFVIGFSVTRERAQELFFEWLKKNSFFRPGDLIKKAVTEKQQGVYIPFWHFSMIAESRWTAQIGEYWYRTETYTVRDSDGKTKTMTRTVREIEWWPLSGIFRKYYSGYLVSASRGLPQAEALAIHPYQLNAMVRFRPMYLAGWTSEEYSIERAEAERVTKQEFVNRQQMAISQFLPGDEHTQLSIDTDLEVGGSDLLMLPVHILSYRYGDRTFRFLVNGQTGKTYGDKPWSAKRITLVIVLVAIFILLLIGLVILFSNPRFAS